VNVPQKYLKYFFKKILITATSFDWERKKGFSADSVCSSRSTAGRSYNHLVSQWHNICFY